MSGRARTYRLVSSPGFYRRDVGSSCSISRCRPTTGVGRKHRRGMPRCNGHLSGQGAALALRRGAVLVIFRHSATFLSRDLERDRSRSAKAACRAGRIRSDILEAMAGGAGHQVDGRRCKAKVRSISRLPLSPPYTIDGLERTASVRREILISAPRRLPPKGRLPNRWRRSWTWFATN